MRLPAVVREINAFVVVGVAATCCQVGVSLAAHALLALPALAATVVGYCCAVGISYLGNSLLTFRRRALDAPQFVRFAVISGSGLAVNLGVVFAATRGLGWSYPLAQIPVVLVVPASTFVIAKFWAFRGPSPKSA
jgi:putative flippase GtrA